VKSRPPPPELQELWLCRDVYKCTPSELDEQDAETILAHIVCMNGEDNVRKAERNSGIQVNSANHNRSHNRRRG
jgi:hypothetical protein